MASIAELSLDLIADLTAAFGVLFTFIELHVSVLPPPTATPTTTALAQPGYEFS
jgi:hypothetical protein